MVINFKQLLTWYIICCSDWLIMIYIFSLMLAKISDFESKLNIFVKICHFLWNLTESEVINTLIITENSLFLIESTPKFEILSIKNYFFSKIDIFFNFLSKKGKFWVKCTLVNPFRLKVTLLSHILPKVTSSKTL